MASDEMMKAIKGSMDKLTHNGTNIIRIFFSSTFTDMKEERNLLMREAVPELKAYCQGKGFDLEVVDMRWGVREDAATEHAVSEICLRAIDNCQNLSEGPNFVLFLGNKYGFRPLPSAIPVTEFRLFRRLAYWMEISFEIVEKWYLLDTNAVPAEYRILPITTLLPYYNNMNPVNKVNRLVHVANWESDERNMRNAFRRVALMALDQGKITAQQCDRYFVSVTESEVTKGILNCGDVKDKVVCFTRSLLKIDTSDPVASRFIDMTVDGEIDTDAQDMLTKLATVKLPKAVPSHQILESAINWEPSGINPDDDVHGRYLIMFSEWFKTLIREQVDKAINRCKENAIKNEMHAEVARHLAIGVMKCQCCFGQEELINEILKLIQRSANQVEVESPTKQFNEEDDNKDDDENKAEESENKLEENAEYDDNDNEDGGFNPHQTAENNVKPVEVEEEEKQDANSPTEDEASEDKDNEEAEEDAESKGRNMVEGIVKTLKERGLEAPTIGYGLADKASDPSYNSKEKLISFTQTDNYKQPVIIHGESGSGKSVIISRVAQLLKTLEPNSVIVIRFLGTTIQAKTIRSVLCSIINNIWAAYNVRHDDLDLSSDVIFLGQYLQALMWLVSTEERPLYILLDALDQLLPLEQAHSLTWLPTFLPPNGSLIISTLPHHNSILESAQRVLPNPRQFLEVLPFGESAAEKIISAISNMKSRSITRPQRNFLKERFRECPSPLFLKLITDQALKWRSHQVVKDLLLGSTVVHAITHLLMNMEKNHGIVFVSRAFGYITAMKHGATFTEIDHLLSLDNEVLHDTYIFHLPPDATHIRFPASVWSSLWLDAMEYLTTEGSHGNITMAWYHRAFQEACEERYLTDEMKKKIHCFAAKFFMGYWHNKVKPLCLFKEKKGWYPDNTRQVPAQPLYFKDGRLNIRKLTELPHHLSQGGMWREFHKEVVCNIDFLVAKAQAYGVVELRADLMNFLMHRFEFDNDVIKDDVDDPPAEDDEEEKSEEKNEDEENKEESGDKQDDDLFLTENKKQGETVVDKEETAEQTQTTSSPVEEIKEDSCQADLETVLRDVEILIDVINLGIDAVRQNGLNLPAQIICQLGKQKAPTASLQKLVDDCFVFMEEHELPLLTPTDSCMTMPGGMLQLAVNVGIFLNSSDRQDGHPVQYSTEDFYLYAVEWSESNKDTLLVLDMAQGGEKVMVADTKTCVHSIQFNKNRKLLMMRYYKEPTRYQPVLFYRLYEGRQLTPYTLDKEALSMDVSAEGDIVAYADDRCCFICSPKRETLTLDVIYKLHHTESITNILFSPDAYYLVTFNKGDGFKVWVPRRGEATLTIDGDNQPTFRTQSQSGMVVCITKTQKLLQVSDTCGSKVTMYNLSSGEIIHELQSPELTYRIELMEMDDEEEYLLVATKETSVLNGKTAKSALLWELETGKVISRVSSAMPFQSIKLLVEENTIYIIAAYKRPIIEVYSVGLRHRPLAGAKLIRTIKGHTKPIIQLSIVIPEGSGGGRRLVSASCDNTVKFWDLDQVLTPEPKQTKKDCGKSTALAISKDDKSVFYGTAGGFVEQVCLSNGEKKTIASDLEHPVQFLLVSKNGKFLIAAVQATVYVYLIATGEMEYSLESCHASRISCIAECNNILVAGHSGMEAKGRIWDLSNGTVIKDVSFLYSFYQTTISPSGTQLGITMFEYPIMVNVYGEDDTENGVRMEQVDTMMAGCTHLEFSPDGKMLVSASVDGRVRVIDAETGKYLHTMVQSSSVPTLAFSWDSRHLVTAGFKSVYVWNIGSDHPDDEKGQLKVKLTKHGDFITSLKLVLDSRFLITGSLDKTIAIWSMKSKTSICSFRAHCPIERMVVASDLSSISFIPDQSANIAILKLNKAGLHALKEIPDKPLPPTVKKAQHVALTFSTQEVAQKTSATCSIL